MIHNPLAGELRNPFRNAKVVADQVDPDVYHRQEPGVGPGHKDFVQTRSELMLIRQCPAKWRAGWEHKDSDATEFGSALDCLLLTSGQFLRRYVVTPETCTATKTMKCVKDGEAREGDSIPWNPLCAEAKEWKEANTKDGVTILSSNDREALTLAANRLLGDEKIKFLLDCSRRQVLVVGEYCDPETKIVVPVKSLLDLEPAKDSAHSSSLGDLKTARNAAPGAWVRAVDERDYDAQAAMSLDLYNAATGEARDTFLHVICENTPPFQAGRRFLSQEFIEMGRAKILGALRLYCQCLADGKWPDWDSNSSYNGWGLIEPEPWMLKR